MKVQPLEIPDVKLLFPCIHSDTRGFFMETWNQRNFEKAGIQEKFVQDNHSLSKRNTLRGLHYQIINPQAKLLHVVKGKIFDVAVDLRLNSEFLGKFVSLELSSADNSMLFIPSGFAHGFLVLSDEAEVQYKCSDYYNPAGERCISWNDPELSIPWPLSAPPLLSDKDNKGLLFRDAEKYQFEDLK